MPANLSCASYNEAAPPFQVTSEQQVKSAIDQVKQEFGRLDVILNAAGVAYGFKLYNKNKHEICPLDRIQKTMDVGPHHPPFIALQSRHTSSVFRSMSSG